MSTLADDAVTVLTASKSNWLYFRAPFAQQAYEAYREKEVSHWVLCTVMVIGTLVQAVYAARTESARNIEMMTAVRAIRILFLLPGWMFWYRIYSLHYNRPLKFACFSTASLANLAMIGFTLTMSLILIVRTAIGDCVDNEASSNCNPNHNSHELPTDAMISILFVVIGLQALVKCYHACVLALCWMLGFASLIFCIVWANLHESTLIIVIYILIAFFLYEYERNKFNTFIALQNVEQSVRTRMHAENEKRVVEMRSMEMRHLLGNVAHDLKTPMQSFVMDLELVDKIMKRPVSQTAEFVSYAVGDLRKMVESIQNLTDTNSFMYMVINRAIDFAKSSSDHILTPNLETINVVKSIQWAIDVVKSKCSVPVVLEPLHNGIHPHIITDKQWLIENILCLISNAAKFTTTGGVTVRCELQLSQPSTSVALQDDESTASQTSRASARQVDELLIEVEDTGIGIPEDKRESMFQPFQQTMRMAGGTGLGLYSLRNRVEALKGTCGILGRRDGASGARIWFCIPYRPDKSLSEDESRNLAEEVESVGVELLHLHSDISRITLDITHMLEPSSVENEATSCQILVVDDSVTIRKSISRVLCNEGLSVDLAENGQMALEMMGLKRYDLVLMDLQMPVMDGLEAVRRLRQQESDMGGVFHQKVIGISAYTGEPYCSDALTAGMDAFIEKPFSAKRFVEICVDQGIRTA